jgi:hypothetical protein
LLAALALIPGPAFALCAVEGKLEVVRVNLDEPTAFVVHIRQPSVPVSNAFHLERTAAGGLGDIPLMVQVLSLANPATTTVLAVGDAAACPDAAEIALAQKDGRGVASGRLVRIFVKYR